MLFKQMFNWLKLKTLPSSILFKNRLFIERDSKHRRVMSNWGLVFRNSKWTNYSLSNVSLRSLVSFSKISYSIIILVFILILTSQHNFYNIELNYNSLAYLYWSLKAQASHIIFVTFWSFYYIFNTLFNKVFYTYINKFFDVDLHKTDETLNTNLLNKETYNISELQKNKLIETLLTQNISNSKISNKLEVLFDTETADTSKQIQVISDLYKTVYTLSLLNNNKVSRLPHIIKHKSSKRLQTNHHFITPLSKWTLNTFDNSLNYNKHSNQPEGLFYINDSNYRTLNNNLNISLVSLDLQNQINMVGIQRFMFKYNPLHRNVMKGSLDLTHTKRLINLSPNNVNTSLKQSNLWLSTNDRQLTNFNKSNVVKICNSTEDSYFFALKRFSMFNKLSANNTSVGFKKLNNHNFLLDHEVSAHTNLLATYNIVLNRLLTINCTKYDIISTNPSKLHNLVNTISLLTGNTDLIINFEDNTLFNGDESLFSAQDQLSNNNSQLTMFSLILNKECYALDLFSNSIITDKFIVSR